MTVRINDKLIHFFNNIDLEYSYKNINLDFMDYFPLLKQGITLIDTYYNIAGAYGVKNDIIELGPARSMSDYIMYEFFKKFNSDEDPYILTATEMYRNEINIFKKDLDKELALSEELIMIIKYSSVYNQASGHQIGKHMLNINKNQERILNITENLELYVAMILCSSKLISNHCILDEILNNNEIRLLYNVLTDNREDMIMCLYIEDIYINNNNLYVLAILCEHIEIANMIKDITIKRNWIEKQILINNFESLLQTQTNIPDIIFNHIKSFGYL